MDKYRSELELDDPMEIWRRHIERELDAYMGLIFERVSRQAYFRMRAPWELPIVREWGRWEVWTATVSRPRSILLRAGQMG
ncbi:MAG: DUF234 domain-containing protein [Steroidobacteraceae bacterium]